MTRLSCPAFLQYVRERVGVVHEAKLVQLPRIENRRTNDFTRISLQYETKFERVTVPEHFEWRVSADTAILTSYRLSALPNENR